jgi:hypothetical protein
MAPDTSRFEADALDLVARPRYREHAATRVLAALFLLDAADWGDESRDGLIAELAYEAPGMAVVA